MSGVPARRAMILAAGRGERLRPLTDACPKPLLTVAGRPLIDYHLEALARVGIREVVINLSWLGEQIRAALGAGERFGLTIRYSEEGSVALETGGGIFRALQWLGEEPFLVVNGDVHTDYDLAELRLASDELARLVLVPNPSHHPGGDFALEAGRIVEEGPLRYTYSGIGLYTAALFSGCSPGRFPLKPLLDRAIAQGRLGGVLHTGHWTDVGTVERMAALEAALTGGSR
ncbi:MAG: N-acetylmuramate alpha-1-phosphate uridylyltransferase MurU [Steroidobacteraceae bacterium]